MLWSLVLASGVLAALGALSGFLEGYGQKDRAQHSAAIVVLGAGVRADGRPGKGLRRRVRHAVELYEKGYAPQILMTGGIGKHPPAEAEVAAELAIANGVPRSAILLESRSTSTWENAVFTAEICKEKGWENVLIVSDPFHLWRAERNFAKCGLPTSSSPAARETWQQQPLARAFWTVRETLLVVRDGMLGRI